MARFVPHDAVRIAAVYRTCRYPLRQGPFNGDRVKCGQTRQIARNNDCGESSQAYFAAAISAPHTTAPRIANIDPAPSFGRNAASVGSPASPRNLFLGRALRQRKGLVDRYPEGRSEARRRSA